MLYLYITEIITLKEASKFIVSSENIHYDEEYNAYFS